MRSSGASVRSFGPLRLRRSLTFAMALAVTLPSLGAAQDGPKSYKKWIFGVAGALIVGVPINALVADDGFNGLAPLMGGTIGFLVGAEMDRTYVRRMAAGPTLRYSHVDVALDLVPDRIKGFRGGAAVVGVGGARVVLSDGSVRARGGGVRGIEDVAVIPSLDLLVLSTFSNLISFPIEDDAAQGQVIDERGGGMMESFSGRLAVAGFDSLRLLDLSKGPDGVGIQTLAGLESLGFVTDMEFDSARRIGWVLMEDRLTSFSADLEKIGETVLPAAGRTVRAEGNRLAVAAGTEGVYILDATDPAAADVVQQYRRVKFAYAADLDGERLYIAAGPEGVPMVDISGDEPKVIGVARKTRFAVDVVTSGPGRAWILDRDGKTVQIADFGVKSAAGTNEGR